MSPYEHAVNTAKRFGGQPSDYIDIHEWFDETKQYTGDWRHRVLRHHAAGIQWAIKPFGQARLNSDGNEISVKLIGEQHVIEDCGFVPTIQDWLSVFEDNHKGWMKLNTSEKIINQGPIG